MGPVLLLLSVSLSDSDVSLSGFGFVEFTEDSAICKTNKLSFIKQGKRVHFVNQKTKQNKKS